MAAMIRVSAARAVSRSASVANWAATAAAYAGHEAQSGSCAPSATSTAAGANANVASLIASTNRCGDRFAAQDRRHAAPATRR